MLSVDNARMLVSQLAPELDIEVLAHRPEWACPPGALAWSCHGRHLGLRDALRELDRWHGEWPSVVVFCGEPTIEVLLHEAAHLLPARPPIADDGEPVPEAASLLQGLQLHRWSTGRDRAGQVPWAGHGPAFVRAACHLWVRAELDGLSIDANRLYVAGDCCGLSHIADYRNSLASEPLRYRFKTFGDILSAQLPSEFVELFATDAREWYRYALSEGMDV